MSCHTLTHEISEHRYSHLPVCPRSMPGTGKKSGTTDVKHTKIVPVHPKTLQRKKTKRKRKVTAEP